MKIKRLSLLIFFISLLTIEAQEVGYTFSMNGEEYDQMITHEHAARQDLSSYVDVTLEGATGTAFHINGNKKDYADIILTSKGVKFTERGYSEKFDLSKYEKFVIAGDTIITVADTVLNKKPKFKKFLAVTKMDETADYELYQLILNNKNQYYLKNKGTNDWKIIKYSFNKEFQKEVVSLFTHLPYIKLKKNSFEYRDIKKLMKTVRYCENHIAGKSLYFNSRMRDVADKSLMSYYCKIDAIKDSIWNISFYNREGKKTFKGQYSDISPLTKQGKMEWFYPDGKIRKEAQFINNNLEGFYTAYNHNGTKHSTYKYNKKMALRVESIFNEDGTEQTKGIKKHTYYDYINDRTLELEYQNKRLDKVSYVDKKSSIRYHLLTDSPASSRSKGKIVYPGTELKKGIEGMIRFKIMLDETGKVIYHEVLPNGDTRFTKATLDYVFNKEVVKFKPAKNLDKKVRSEFIYTVAYKLNKTVSHNNNYFMFHQMMMQQQMMQHQMSVPPRL